MDLFGFEEDLDLYNSEIASNSVAPQSVPQTVSSETDKSKLTISQIQDLLSKDLADDSVSDQDTLHTSDTSIFEETTSSLPDPPKLRAHRNRVIEKTFEETNTVGTENSAESEFVIPVVRAYPKPNRKKKVLRSIENTHVNGSLNSSSSDKPKKPKRKKGKPKIKNDENKNVDSRAEEINNKFKEVEKYKLVVE